MFLNFIILTTWNKKESIDVAFISFQIQFSTTEKENVQEKCFRGCSTFIEYLK